MLQCGSRILGKESALLEIRSMCTNAKMHGPVI